MARSKRSKTYSAEHHVVWPDTENPIIFISRNYLTVFEVCLDLYLDKFPTVSSMPQTMRPRDFRAMFHEVPGYRNVMQSLYVLHRKRLAHEVNIDIVEEVTA
jgi:hypothetical protein